MIAMNPRQHGPIPDREWDQPATVAALRDRDARALLRLARKYGASQHFLSARAMYLTNQSLTQNQLSLIASGKHQVEKLQVWERLAAALDMPDRARILLGLAPLAPDRPTGVAGPKGNGQSGDIYERLAHRPDRETAGHLAALVHELRKADDSAPTGTLLSASANLLELAVELIETASPFKRQEIGRVAAEAATLHWWLMVDSGRDAKVTHDRAMALAVE